MARVLGLKQLLAKKYDFLQGLPEEIVFSFGRLTSNFIMLIWGDSANGKSNFLMQFLKAIMPYGNVLYVGLEEGFESTMQIMAVRHFTEEVHSGKIGFADHEMIYDELVIKLKKKKSPRFIIIDSVQYWDITYPKYKKLKEMFKKKSFIFISHATGKEPRGTTAQSIRYDAGLKVRVEGFIAFPLSRYGGNRPYVIFEEGARKYWGSEYKKILQSVLVNDDKKVKPKKKNENAPIQETKPLEQSEKLVLGNSSLHGESEGILSEVGNATS
jgi:hypothetical protein